MPGQIISFWVSLQINGKNPLTGVFDFLDLGGILIAGGGSSTHSLPLVFGVY